MDNIENLFILLLVLVPGGMMLWRALYKPKKRLIPTWPPPPPRNVPKNGDKGGGVREK